MKVKLIKREGLYRLCVDDDQINSNCQYASIEEPILLVNFELYEGTKCWSLQDIRLHDVIIPAGFDLNSDIQRYTPENEEDANRLKSLLHTYKESSDGKISWSTFNGVVPGGTKLYKDTPNYVDRYHEGRWGFKEGMEKIKEIRQFWESYEGKIEDAQLDNPQRQINVMEYRFKYVISPSLSKGVKP